MDSVVPDEPESWFKVEGLTTRRALSSQMFVAQVQGKSMEPVISGSSRWDSGTYTSEILRY